jgi:hypothetical protein
VTLFLVLVSLSRGSADELSGSDRPLTAGEIAALIRKLESRKFREREEASRALEAAGEDALNALRQASEQSNDPASVATMLGSCASIVATKQAPPTAACRTCLPEDPRLPSCTPRSETPA